MLLFTTYLLDYYIGDSLVFISVSIIYTKLEVFSDYYYSRLLLFRIISYDY